MSRDMDDILESVEQDFRNEYDPANPGRDVDDLIFEMADQAVPVYTGDLLSLCDGDYTLFTCLPEFSDFENDTTPDRIVAINVFEKIEQHLQEVRRKMDEEYNDLEECEECGEKITDADERLSCAVCGALLHVTCQDDHNYGNHPKEEEAEA